MRPRLAWQIFSLELRNLLNYRVDFWVNWLMATAAQLAVAWFLWTAVYEYTGRESVGGYSLHAMMLYYTLAVLVDRAVQGSGRNGLSTDIYEGTLNRYLVYPVPLFRYKLLESWAHTLFAGTQGLLLLAGFTAVFGLPADAPVTVWTVALGMVTLFAAAVLFLAMSMIVEQVAFWADNVWSLSVMLQFVFRLAGGVLVPLALFPEAARDVLHWLPFSTLVHLPIAAFMGQINLDKWLEGMALMAGWAVFLWFVVLWIWKRGTLKYSGVGI